ncbi:MAG: ribonuclease E/G, partial [Pseudomonadota bacterium]
KARVFEEAKAHIERFRPDFMNRVKLYQGDVPLFTHYQIESQIESAFQREVRLPSGGSIVIDPTEALTSIDINSSKATKGGDIEETALNTNLEAADEIARQLRLRDLGGLIVIDFIDMTPPRHQREVENRLKDAARPDRARVQIGKISRFGLLEMSRQRLRPSLGEASQGPCPRCNGQGTIRSNESIALSILRLIEEEAIKDNTSQVNAQVPVAVAAYLLNEKRRSVQRIEKRHNVDVVIIPNQHMETPHYEVLRLRKDETIETVSYEQVIAPEPEAFEMAKAPSAPVREEPVLKGVVMPTTPAPQAAPKAEQAAPAAKKSEGGLFAAIGKFFKSLFGAAEDESEKEQEEKKAAQKRSNNRRNNDNRRRSNNQRRRNSRNKRPEDTQAKEENTNTSAPEQKDTNENRNKRRRNSNNRKRNEKRTDDVEQTTKETVQETQSEQPKETKPKVRRQRRNLRKKVRVQDENADETNAVQTAETAEQAPKAEKPAKPAKETVELETEQTEQAAAEVQAKAEPVSVHADAEVTEQAESVEVSADEEQAQPRTRSRRSPRHLRAAGQRRRRPEQDEKSSDAKSDTPAFIPVADQAAAEYEAELKAKQAQAEVSVQAEEPVQAEELVQAEEPVQAE